MGDPPRKIEPEAHSFSLPVRDAQGIEIGTVDLGEILGDLGTRDQALAVARSELADARRQIETLAGHMERMSRLLETLSDELRETRPSAPPARRTGAGLTDRDR